MCKNQGWLQCRGAICIHKEAGLNSVMQIKQRMSLHWLVKCPCPPHPTSCLSCYYVFGLKTQVLKEEALIKPSIKQPCTILCCRELQWDSLGFCCSHSVIWQGLHKLRTFPNLQGSCDSSLQVLSRWQVSGETRSHNNFCNLKIWGKNKSINWLKLFLRKKKERKKGKVHRGRFHTVG